MLPGGRVPAEMSSALPSIALVAGPDIPFAQPHFRTFADPLHCAEPLALLAAAKVTDPDKPGVRTALQGPDAPQWVAAMQAELAQLQQHGTFEVVPTPKGIKPTPCKWVLTVKRDAEGNIEKHKARLVFRGDLQIKGHDFDDTFAPTGTMDAVRMFFALTAALDLDWLQLDVSGAFLNGNLDQNVYMQVPAHSSSALPDVPAGYCLRLLKTLYGLRQAPREWRKVLNAELTNLGLASAEPDVTIYKLHNDQGYLLIKVWVDDMLIAGTGWNIIAPLKQRILATWKCHDLGEPAQFLGLRITRDRAAGTITLSQTKYIQRILQLAAMKDAKGTHTPMEPGKRLDLPGEHTPDARIGQLDYRQALGMLGWVQRCTRPDLSFAQHEVGTASGTSWAAMLCSHQAHAAIPGCNT